MKLLSLITIIALSTGCASFGDRVSEARRAGQQCTGQVTLTAIQLDAEDERIELVCKWEA